MSQMRKIHAYSLNFNGENVDANGKNGDEEAFVLL